MSRSLLYLILWLMTTLTVSSCSDDDIQSIGGNDKLLLIRMLARLDVSVRSDVEDFQLVSAEISNRKNMGYLAYADANKWDTDNN